MKWALGAVAVVLASGCGSSLTVPDAGTSGGGSGGTVGGTTSASSGGTTGGVCLLVNASCGSTLQAGCCEGLTCISNDNDSECLIPNGGSCSKDFNCVSQSCDGGSCVCQTLGSLAVDGSGCCSPLSIPNGPGGGNCCGPAGFSCKSNSDCCGGNCQSGGCL